MKLLLSSLVLASVVAAEDWAVIVAGSKTYGNYRHQADACHAYQVVHKYGIPDSNVITMFFDDIAESFQNPFKGQIFNAPTEAGTPGQDVYEGCKKDYTGKDVTPQNFLAVLTGDSSKVPSGKPVLKSGKGDRVFINFVDHGGVGIIAFPSAMLSSQDLNAAIKTAHSKNMFEKMVFYMEACESGSMFENILDPSINVYATTAANPDESSWGTFCPPDDKVNGKNMNTCLGDLYSVNWMANAEKAGMSETLADQYTEVKTATAKSHVMQYGDLDFTSDPIGDYMGNGTNVLPAVASSPARKPNPAGIVNSRDIPVHLAYYNYLRTDAFDLEARKAAAAALKAQVDSRLKADVVFHTLAQSFGKTEMLSAKPQTPVLCGECCKQIHEVVAQDCGGYDDYSLKYVRLVHNLCVNFNYDLTKAAQIGEKLRAICHSVETENF